jgi:hypothetical protein
MQQSMSKRAYWQRYFASQTWKVKLISHSVKHKFCWKAKMRYLQLYEQPTNLYFSRRKVFFFPLFSRNYFFTEFVYWIRSIDRFHMATTNQKLFCAVKYKDVLFFFVGYDADIYRNSSVQYQHHIICYICCQHSCYFTPIWFLSQHHRMFSSK